MYIFHFFTFLNNMIYSFAYNFCSKMTLIDMISVVPYFLVLMVAKDHLQSFNGLRVVRMARVVRMCRFRYAFLSIYSPDRNCRGMRGV